jgi:ATP-dependent helicase/nuclease subunit B
MPLSVADRGSAIHNTLGDFTIAHPAQLPDDIFAQVQAIGSKHFAALMNRPEARAMWWPRFLRVASWYAGWERERREQTLHVHAEISGRMSFPLDDGRAFTLTTRADRIETHRDGSFALIDYKTGIPPTGKQVRIGLSPQLSLMAAILRDGGFKDIPAGVRVSELTYIRLSGNDPAGQEMILDLKRDRNEMPLTPDELAQEARAKLEQLVRDFDNDDQPYRSMILSMWSTHYGTYDALSRVKEWSAGAGA